MVHKSVCPSQISTEFPPSRSNSRRANSIARSSEEVTMNVNSATAQPLANLKQEKFLIDASPVQYGHWCVNLWQSSDNEAASAINLRMLRVVLSLTVTHQIHHAAMF
jgi:hypothetical protein